MFPILRAWQRLLFVEKNQKTVGTRGELIAKEYLIARGYKHQISNYRAPRWGEIDLIFTKENEIVFIEVKTRVGIQLTDPLEAITKRKQQVLRRTAYHYLANFDVIDYVARFDVITVQFIQKADRNPVIQHIINAF